MVKKKEKIKFKVGIDARMYSQTGVGTYLKNYIYYLNQMDTNNLKIILYLRKNDFNKVSISNQNITKKIANYTWHSLNEQLGFLFFLLREKLDLIHFPYFSFPFLYPKKFITTIHDITPYLFKTGKASTRNLIVYRIKHFFYTLGLLINLIRAEKIIVPTKTVKKIILETFSFVSEKKLLTIYEGVDYELTISKENKSLSKMYKNFYLYVGNFYPHKNLENLISAFNLMPKNEENVVFVGPKNFFSERLKLLIKKKYPKLRRIIKFFHNPKKEDLVFFYKNALALINPSLSEGFGLPLVEAIHFGCPVIASNIPVFQEILDGAYIKFDPNDPKSIGSALINFKNHREELKNKSIDLSRYSFKKMTKKTLKVYYDILSI